MNAAERIARDATIRRLHAEGHSTRAIAAAVGCSSDVAWEVALGRREERNRRRLERYHRLRTVA